jgi:cystathionine gamma-synthase
MTQNTKKPARARQITQAVRAGLECDDATGCVVPPIHLTSTFAFRGFGQKRNYDYTRSGNPTRDLLGSAIAELELGVGAVVTATGMAAITLVGYLIPAKGRIVAPHDCYGGTYRLFNAWHQRGEREVEFVNFGDEAAVRAALSKPTALLWIETPSNPLLRITDISARPAARWWWWITRSCRQPGNSRSPWERTSSCTRRRST